MQSGRGTGRYCEAIGAVTCHAVVGSHGASGTPGRPSGYHERREGFLEKLKRIPICFACWAAFTGVPYILSIA